MVRENTFEEFIKKVTNAFEAYIGSDAHVIIQKVKKKPVFFRLYGRTQVFCLVAFAVQGCAHPAHGNITGARRGKDA